MLRLNRTLGCLLDAVLIGLTALTLRWPHGFHHYADSEHARGTSGRRRKRATGVAQRFLSNTHGFDKS